MRAGVVLQPEETVYRQVPLWVRVQQDGWWAAASFADVLVTDLRLLCRFSSGHLTSLWWCGVVGLHVDLATEHIVLDYGDGQPVGLLGRASTHGPCGTIGTTGTVLGHCQDVEVVPGLDSA